MGELIRDFCEDYGYRLYENYSGRCMYGATCVGIVCENVNYTLQQLVEYVGEESIRSIARYDNLGLSMILYFPSIA